MNVKNTNKTGAFLIFLFLLVLILSISCKRTDRPLRQNIVEKGIVDLRTWNFDRNGVADLRGDWEFYWQQLLSPEDFRGLDIPVKTGYMHMPSLWTYHDIESQTFEARGYATYRLLVKINPTSEPLTLMISDIVSTYRLWVNGKLISEDGVFGLDDSKEVRSTKRISFVPLPAPTEETLEFVLQVTNRMHWGGGAHSSFRIGLEKDIKSFWISRGFFLIASISILFIIALYHMVLFGFRRKDLSALYFSIYCFLWLISCLNQQTNIWLLDYLFGYLPYALIWRLELFGYFLSNLLLCLFYYSFYPKEITKRLVWAYLAISFFFNFLVLFLQEISKHVIEDWFNWITIFSIIWGIVAITRAIFQKRPGSLIHFFGLLFIFPFTVNDILYDKRVIDTGYSMPVGLLVFIFVQSFSIAFRFSKAFTTSEQLAAELNEKNIALARLDKLKDEFLANTSHELRTPLAGIIGISESLLAGAAGNLQTPVKNNLDMVVASGRRLSNRVNDILDFSRLRNKDLALIKKAVDLRALIDSVLAVMKPLADRKGLAFHSKIPEDNPTAWGDEDRLQQVFYNLIGNAIKFTEQGSITVSIATADSNIIISISDTGIGIPKDKLDDIFHSFEQVDSTAARKFGGTGLGLSISKQLVELHEGTLQVESELEKGSTFFFNLPITGSGFEQIEPVSTKLIEDPELIESVPVIEYHSQQQGNVNEYSVLVVDDDPVNLQVAINHLMLAGLKVQTATSGVEALEIINSRKRPDLVLLDIMMPGMTGYEVCRKLRENHSISELPVIMLTAKNRMTDLVEGFESGANDYVTKPFSKKELLARAHSQIKLKQAYLTLQENVRLKKEIEHRKQTEQNLRLIQRRLSVILNMVDDAIIAINEYEEVTFCNKPGEELLANNANDLLGKSIWEVFEENASRKFHQLISVSEKENADKVTGKSYFKTELTSKHTKSDVQVLVTQLEFEDETLYVFLLKKTETNNISPIDHQKSENALALIEVLNNNQKRIQRLERTLTNFIPEIINQAPEIISQISAIDKSLEGIDPSHLSSQDQSIKRQLGVNVMNLAIDYWVETTGTTKSELAFKSSLWKVYTNQDGWERTRTLDKYLNINTLPKRPKWRLITETAHFVLIACEISSSTRQMLETALEQFRQPLH